jgi:hypothetical protein
MSKLLRLLGRLFGSAGSKTDQQIGEAAILGLLTGPQGFAEGIIRSLNASEGWPFDLGDGTSNLEEQIMLNIWGFTVAVRKCFPGVSGDEKRAFLELVYNWFFDRELRGEAGLERELALNRLAVPRRFLEYDTAFNEMQRRRRVRDEFAEDPLVKLVVKNLFGRESNSVSVWVKVAVALSIYLTSFASSFGSPRGWQAMQSIIRERA